MKFTRVFASAAFLACAAAGAGQTATLRNADEPAEFPPASYKGQQYVDSRGCVYIRAGIDGNVTWVPRVTRGRKHICDAQPTFAKPAAKNLPVIADKPAQPTQPAAAEKVTAASQPVKKRVKVVRQTEPASKPRTTRKPMTTIASIFTPPKMIKPVRPAPQARPAANPAPAPAATTCRNISEIGRKYMTGSGLRCGPQAESPFSATRGTGQGRVAPSFPAAAPAARPVSARPVAVSASAKSRIMLGRVYDNPVHVRDANPIPEGYRPVWDDDRLNPYRGGRDARGMAQMDLVWTRTVPRQLIDRTSGRDVTRQHPNLRYPFTDLTTQVRTVAAAERVKAEKKTQGVMSTKSRAPVRSAPAAKTARTEQANGRTYVQVGTFGVPDNARNTALRLKGAGLPVRVWTTKRKGKPYQVVVAGPFPSASGAQQALGTVRKAGFADAFLRR